MAPVSTSAKPSRAARRRAAVLLPAPAGPSMATMAGRWLSGTSALLGGEDAHLPVLLVAVADELLRTELLQLRQVPPQRHLHVGGGRRRIAVRAAGRLLHD